MSDENHKCLKNITEKVTNNTKDINKLLLNVEKIDGRLKKIEYSTSEIRESLLGNEKFERNGFIKETKIKILEFEDSIKNLYNVTSITTNRKYYLVMIITIIAVVGVKDLLSYILNLGLIG